MKSSLQKLGLAVLGLLSLAGVWALAVRLTAGLSVTQLTSEVPWGMWVSIYIYCIGLSAGSFLMSTLVYVFGMHQFEKMGRMALLSALFALAAGMTFIWIDLGHPFRFYKIFTGWQVSSVLAWESLFYIFYIIAICAELWLLMRCDLATLAETTEGPMASLYRLLSLGWRCPEDDELRAACHLQSMRWVKVIGCIGVPVAIGVHGGTGAIFAVVAAKPYWFSGLFPIIFLVSALVSGCGLMLFLYAAVGRRDEDFPVLLDGLRRFLVLFIAIDVLLFISDTLVGVYGGIPEHLIILQAVVFGDYWYVFWIGQIALAWVVPLVIGSIVKDGEQPGLLAFAGGCVVVGIACVRLNLVIPAYLIEHLPGLAEALPDPRMAYSYFPSPLEWISTLGLLSLFTLAFIVVWQILPLYELRAEHAVAAPEEARVPKEAVSHAQS